VGREQQSSEHPQQSSEYEGAQQSSEYSPDRRKAENLLVDQSDQVDDNDAPIAGHFFVLPTPVVCNKRRLQHIDKADRRGRRLGARFPHGYKKGRLSGTTMKKLKCYRSVPLACQLTHRGFSRTAPTDAPRKSMRYIINQDQPYCIKGRLRRKPKMKALPPAPHDWNRSIGIWTFYRIGNQYPLPPKNDPSIPLIRKWRIAISRRTAYRLRSMCAD